jgi:N-acetylmuramoyl-L-alanine amidase
MNAKGYFAHGVSLQPGDNTFVLTEVDDPGQRREVVIKRDVPPPPISTNVLKISIDTATPDEDTGVSPGDIVQFSVHATPDSRVTIQIGKVTVQLCSPAVVKHALKSKKHSRHGPSVGTNVNLGLDVAYGKMYQKLPSTSSDLYAGFYKVLAGDHWNNVVPKFSLSHGGKTITAQLKAHLTTVPQPILAQTRHDKTIVRVGPNLSRATPLPQDVRVVVDGWHGDQMRCAYSPNYHVWIPKDDLALESANGESGPWPQSTVRTINTLSDDYGADCVIPLSQRLPFQIEQRLKPNTLVLKIFGGIANTDWVTPIVPSEAERELIDHVTFKQASDGVYEVSVELKQSRQWGFFADYNDTSLHLHIKRPPRLVSTAQGQGAKRLDGLVVCIDPGHGGSENGAIGCGGKREADLNLGIALKLRELLDAAGAKVIMTRSTDSLVSLDERVDIANRGKADILLSIHNNALPDGRDPWSEHGTSSYWYHPQAIELARRLKYGVEHVTGFQDLSTRWQNLALTRPSAMVSVLCEIGFVINPDEYAVLEEPVGQEKAAQGLLKGLIDYLNET